MQTMTAPDSKEIVSVVELQPLLLYFLSYLVTLSFKNCVYVYVTVKKTTCKNWLSLQELTIFFSFQSYGY